MNSKIFFLVCMAAVTAADKRPSFSYGAPQFSSEETGPAQYNFNWAVNDAPSANDFGHQETRDNDNTQGSYSVQLPDGRLQTVTYYVNGDSGYIADVQYKGEARYPDSDEVRSYAPPRPQYG
ncbi:pro-resilin [Procambarus clarkii]|uniref:pro-resilin n=1 Tax=Procambarus clarkii TaxID=6728 RepID=UPI001E673D45|nr:pro-resilin-like [Procambarus clarkii]XP_045617284.1 pro-resilin-like [Procambarus clarkii]